MKNTVKHSLLAAALVFALIPFSSLALADSSDGEGHYHCMGCHHGHEWKKHEFMDKLGLTPEQKQQFEAIRQDKHTQAEALMKSMFEKDRELRQYMASPDANEENALAKEKEISDIHEQMAQLHIQTRFKINAILTPEQREKMSQWRKEKMDRFEHRHAEWHSDRDESSEDKTPTSNIQSE